MTHPYPAARVRRRVFRIADAIVRRYRALVLFAAFTSLRFGELAALLRRDIAYA